jgi:hypothetical protein
MAMQPRPATSGLGAPMALLESSGKVEECAEIEQ